MTRRDNVGSVLAVLLAIGLPYAGQAQDVMIYKGRCDASAAAALDADHFVVANDERNKLQIYRRGRPDPVGPGLDVSGFLGTKVDKESDLEGSATIGHRVFWISSHGNNKEGKFQERRHRFFATDIVPGAPPAVQIVGTEPYKKLLEDMFADARLKPLLSKAAERAPEAPGGLNIEGLAATPDGKLLIGFRNPIPKEGALIVPLENPNDLLEGKPAKLGAPIALKGLGDNGIRSFERIGTSYLIVAGPPADNGTFGLHRWTGDPNDPATRLDGVDFKSLRPEALFALPDGTIQILSDDGGVKVDGQECKDLDEAKQTFRGLSMKLGG
jgi:hypothetical protein